MLHSPASLLEEVPDVVDLLRLLIQEFIRVLNCPATESTYAQSTSEPRHKNSEGRNRVKTTKRRDDYDFGTKVSWQHAVPKPAQGVRHINRTSTSISIHLLSKSHTLKLDGLWASTNNTNSASCCWPRFGQQPKFEPHLCSAKTQRAQQPRVTSAARV